MSSKLTTPAELVRTLRIGLHSELGHAASEIHRITYQRGREEHPEWYQEGSGATRRCSVVARSGRMGRNAAAG